MQICRFFFHRVIDTLLQNICHGIHLKLTDMRGGYVNLFYSEQACYALLPEFAKSMKKSKYNKKS